MLTRIFLFIALAAVLAVSAVNILVVKDKINTIVTDRNTQRENKVQAMGERDTAKKERDVAKKELEQNKVELADAKTERDRAVATASAQVKKAEELTAKLTQTTSERDDAQTKLQAYTATGISSEQVGQLNKLLKTSREELDIAKEEQQVLQRSVDRLQARLDRYEGTNKVVALRPNLRGKILVVDPRWDFVVLNIGLAQGAIENGELLVSREGRLVAKVVIRSIEKNRCIANIVPGWKLGEVIEGDEVTPAHPAI